MSLGAMTSAPADRMTDRLTRQQDQGLVVVHGIAVQHAAVPMRRVFTKAHVGHRDQLGEFALDRAHRLRDRTGVVPGTAPLDVLLFGNAEEYHPTEAAPRRALGVTQHFIHRRLRNAWH